MNHLRSLAPLTLVWIAACSSNPTSTPATCVAGQVVVSAGGDASVQTCAACPDGTFSTGENQVACTAWTACDPGSHESTAGSATADRTCAACAAGTYSTGMNVASCTAWTTCTPGEHVTAAGSATSNQTCAACPTGTYSAAADSATCSPQGACAAGTTQTAAGTATTPTMCQACASGNYCPGGESPAEACAAEAWDDDANPATACVPRTTCAAGEYAISDGSATEDRVCAACPAGSYSTEVNPAACTAQTTCAAGQYVAAAGSATSDRTCAACASGAYSTGTNAASCTAQPTCAAGTVQLSAGTATAPTLCMPCAPGNYCAGDTAPAAACAAGAWDDDANPATVCVPLASCAAGQFVTAAGSATANRTCAACAAGSYSTGTNQAACLAWTACAAGANVSTPGTATANQSCSACAAGTFTSAANQTTCAQWTTCVAGQSVTAAGAATSDRMCAACAAGSFSTGANAGTCTVWTGCPAGSSVSTPGTTTTDQACTACAAGTFTSRANEASCTPWTTCPAGTDMTTEGGARSDRICAACADGSFTTGADQATCASWTTCPAGSDVTTPGTATADQSCTACGAGTFTASANQSTCAAWTTCVAGTHVSTAGSATANQSCAACDSGTFTASANQSTCAAWTTCVAGTHVSTAGSATANQSCAACDSGTFTASANLSTCAAWMTCDAGTHVSTAGSATANQSCAACDSGTFTASANQSTCAAWATCVAGTHVSTAGSATADQSCAACDSGTFTASANQSTCAAWTMCDGDEIQTSAPSAVADRVCTPVTALTALEVDAGNTKQTGQTFEYDLAYACGSPSGPCLGAEIDDLLPAAVQFTSTTPASPTGDVAAINVTSNFMGSGRTRVQFVFITPLPAGNSGDLFISVKFANGSTANGTVATNTADGINLGTIPGTFTTPPVSVTAVAALQVSLQNTLTTSPANLDMPESYRLRISNTLNTDGSLNITAIGPVIDTLPAGSVFNSANPAADCEPGCDGTTPATITWISPCSVPLTPGNACDVTVHVTFPSLTFASGANVTNSFTATGTPLGESSQSLGVGQITHSVTTFVPSPGAAIGDDVAAGSPNPPTLEQTFSYALSPANSGNVPLDSMTVIDTSPLAMQVASVTTGAYTGASDFSAGVGVRVGYEKNTALGVFTLWGSSPNATTNTTLTAPPPGLGAGEYITRIRWEYGQAEVGMGATTLPLITGTLINPDNAGAPVGSGDTVQTCAALAAVYTAGPTNVNGNACHSFAVSAPFVELNPGVDVLSGGGPFNPAQTVLWRLRVRSAPQSSDPVPLEDVVAADLLPTDLDYSSWTFDDQGTGLPAPQTFENIANYGGTGRTLLRWRWNAGSGALGTSQQVWINISTTIAAGAPNESLANSLDLSANDVSLGQRCSADTVIDSDDLDGDSDTGDSLCVAMASVSVQ